MPDTAPAPRGTCLAFDFGEKRIGVAQGSAETATAHPLSTIFGGGNEQKFAAIAALIKNGSPTTSSSACLSTATAPNTNSPASPANSVAACTSGLPCRLLRRRTPHLPFGREPARRSARVRQKTKIRPRQRRRAGDSVWLFRQRRGGTAGRRRVKSGTR